MVYRINEILESVVNKGFYVGKSVIVIRLAGCNMHCNFCESDYSIIDEMEVTDILNELKAFDNKTVIISGGEPTLQDLTPLLQALKAKGYWIALETNGTIPLNGILNYIDYVIASPKENFYLIKKADEVVVINSEITFEQLLKVENGIDAANYYLCPVETNNIKNLKETIELLKEINQYSIKKWKIGVPTKQPSDPD